MNNYKNGQKRGFTGFFAYGMILISKRVITPLKRLKTPLKRVSDKTHKKSAYKAQKRAFFVFNGKNDRIIFSQNDNK